MAVVGVVVPTIGQRPQYLESTLSSIREAGDTFVVLVGREDFNGKVSGPSLKILSTSLGLETMTYFLPALY
jgi:hypothetical protein